MKQLLIALFVLMHFCCAAQNKDSDKPLLLLRKNDEANPKELIIKPNRPIKIKTTGGQKFTLFEYSLIGDSVIASPTDTVALEDILFIKATVKGNIIRKVSGGLVAGTGYYFGTLGFIMGTVAFYPPAYLLILPSAGAVYAGHYLSGPRRFDTAEKWCLSVVENPE